MPDVWINLAHIFFAQGNFALAVKMVSYWFKMLFPFYIKISFAWLPLVILAILQYQNCMRKFYYNTDSQILLYLARTHYEAEQWQECKKTLLRAIHLAPSNYTLRFDAGVAMQKFSTSTLQKEKRTADEVVSSILSSFFFILSPLASISPILIPWWKLLRTWLRVSVYERYCCSASYL